MTLWNEILIVDLLYGLLCLATENERKKSGIMLERYGARPIRAYLKCLACLECPRGVDYVAMFFASEHI
jgi:hypothetical protein